jgi:hypothetical protein
MPAAGAGAVSLGQEGEEAAHIYRKGAEMNFGLLWVEGLLIVLLGVGARAGGVGDAWVLFRIQLDKSGGGRTLDK